MPFTEKDLLGFWELESLHREGSGEGVTEWFMTEGAEGFIIYEADGNMCAMLQEAGRSLPGGEVSDADAARAWRAFFAYSARWELEGDTVRHSVRYAHDVRLVGSTFERTISHDGDRMTLAGEDPYNPGHRARIVWRREAP